MNLHGRSSFSPGRRRFDPAVTSRCASQRRRSLRPPFPEADRRSPDRPGSRPPPTIPRTRAGRRRPAGLRRSRAPRGPRRRSAASARAPWRGAGRLRRTPDRPRPPSTSASASISASRAARRLTANKRRLSACDCGGAGRPCKLSSADAAKESRRNSALLSRSRSLRRPAFSTIATPSAARRRSASGSARRAASIAVSRARRPGKAMAPMSGSRNPASPMTRTISSARG